MIPIENISRRTFLEKLSAVSGGLILGAVIPFRHTVASPLDPSLDSLVLNLFVQIAENNQVYIICHRSEMGQGIRTSLPQVVADELQADWAKVQIIQGQANSDYGSQNTDGSRSVRDFYQVMREMGAAARTMLEQAAAARWQVPVEQVSADQHRIVHSLTGRQLSYGQLAQEAAALPIPAKESLVLKPRSAFNYIGQPVQIVDMHDMLTGSAIFGQDIQLPNMRYAAISRSPSLGATLKTFEAKDARKVSGVYDVVVMPDRGKPVSYKSLSGVAVLANNTWAALQGKKQLKPVWQHEGHDSSNYLQGLVSSVQTPGQAVLQRGDFYTAIDQCADTLNATYTVPYQSHLPMETPAAVAYFHQGTCEIWACVQSPQATQQTVATELGIDPKTVKVNVTLLGGAFGRKSKPDFVVEAAYLAQRSGSPVKVFWSREDDIRHDYYHAISAQYYHAGLDNQGRVTAWLQRTAFPSYGSLFREGADMPSDGELSMGFADVPFAMQHLRCERHRAEAHVRIGWLRAVANIHHAFAVNSFVDEIAVKTNVKVTDLWRQLLGNAGTVDPTVDGFNYRNSGKSLDEYPIDIGRFHALIDLIESNTQLYKTLPKNQGWGFSIHRSFCSYVCVATKVEVKNGRVAVVEMHAAIDCGLVVNPDRVRSQLEGSMVFGLSIALMGNMTVKDGQIEQSNFHDAPVTRMHQCPSVTIHIAPGDKQLPGGVGEPGVPPVLASVSNAIYAASGVRIRDLPVNKHFRI